MTKNFSGLLMQYTNYVINRHRFIIMARHGQRNSTVTVVGLESHNRRSRATKAVINEATLIFELHTLRNLGAGQDQSELKQRHSLSLAPHKILCRNRAKLVVKFRRKVDFIRYGYPIPPIVFR